MRTHAWIWFLSLSFGLHAEPVSLESPFLKVTVSPEDGSFTILDKAGGVTWQSNPFHSRFGEFAGHAGKSVRNDLSRCEVASTQTNLVLTFRPTPDDPTVWLRVFLSIGRDQSSLNFSCEAAEGLRVEALRLLDHALWVTDREQGAVVLPVREGMIIPADSGKPFTHRFDTYAYEGCHMQMLGVIKSGAAALVTWRDCDVSAEVQSVLTNAAWAGGAQVLSLSLALSKSAKSLQIQFLGKGDHATIAKAYRHHAKDKGWIVPWDEKLSGNPERVRLFGAVNFKLWSALDRRMNEASTREERVRVNWTFEEAALIAEHLKRDLRLDKVLFTIGGWIHRGYDNQHPDVLPAAPECGGNDALADCGRRIRQLGYLFCLHDNYQDIYRDSPSWNESLIMKKPDGNLTRGGHWAGGVAYLTCAKEALNLAQRPQNLPAVRSLFGPNAYFIDTTYAAGLQECFDPNHPLTRGDDLKWKQALSQYAREIFGVFGSECGREWAIPCSDFFEGLTGVSGRHYHDAGLLSKVGGVPVPLFEMVYRDCIALYGKYGYDPLQSAEYVLQHLIVGRPLHHHNIPAHLYWTQRAPVNESLSVNPGAAGIQEIGAGELQATYRWFCEGTPASDWHAFVHFVDDAGNIQFQNDYAPEPPTSQWKPGELLQGPHRVKIPSGARGTFEVRTGLFQSKGGQRALMRGAKDHGDRSYTIGQLRIDAGVVTFKPLAPKQSSTLADRAVYTRADHGWAAGMHPLDCFIKNTSEILSPVHELTAKMLVTSHEFLRADRLIQKTVIGEGEEAMTIVANAGQETFRYGTGALSHEVILPPYGFLVTSPKFIAFNAVEFDGLQYPTPTLFTIRSLDGKPISLSERVRVFHGFGSQEVRWAGKVHLVEREAELIRTRASP